LKHKLRNKGKMNVHNKKNMLTN